MTHKERSNVVRVMNLAEAWENNSKSPMISTAVISV